MAEDGFFVYIYRDPETREPFYVGKGRGYRASRHLSHSHSREMRMKIRSLKQRGLLPEIEIRPMPSEQDAFFWEEVFIAAFGRRRDGSGVLFNVSEGGAATEGFKGRKHSEESKARIRAALKGRKLSDATKEKLRAIGLARDVSHLHSEKSRQKRKEACDAPEFRKKLSDRMKQVVSADHLKRMTEKAAAKNKGRTVSSETRARMSEASRKRVITDEARRNMSAGQRRRYGHPDP